MPKATVYTLRLYRDRCLLEEGCFCADAVEEENREEKLKMAVISMKQLLEAGVSLSVTRQEDGTLRWLRTSSQKETGSTSSIYRKPFRSSTKLTTSSRKSQQQASAILFVGTKKQAQAAVEGRSSAMPVLFYVNAEMA